MTFTRNTGCTDFLDSLGYNSVAIAAILLRASRTLCDDGRNRFNTFWVTIMIGRVLAGVITGYFVTMLAMFLGLTALYLLLGADATFEPGTYHPTNTWLIPQFVVMFVAAAIGGYVAMVIGRTRSTMIALVVVIAVLGIVSGYYEMTAATPYPGARSSDVSNFDAMMKAQQPDWAPLLKPAIGILGVLVGCRTRRSG